LLVSPMGFEPMLSP